MRFTHGGCAYEIPDEWWDEAGMRSAVLEGSAYPSGPSPFPGIEVALVAVESIAPVQRKATHGVFNDHIESGSAHDRVLNILKGFQSGARLPPIEVSRVPVPAPQEFKLIHGVHRLYCSIAAGYSKIPAVQVIDFFGSPG